MADLSREQLEALFISSPGPVSDALDAAVSTALSVLDRAEAAEACLMRWTRWWCEKPWNAERAEPMTEAEQAVMETMRRGGA